MVTQDLFKKYRSAADWVRADLKEIEQDIKSCGFYHNKAVSIQGGPQKILDDFGGKVPRTMDELVTLPGVGRKTANCVIGNAYGLPAIMCDTHVIRLSRRLQLSPHCGPGKARVRSGRYSPQRGLDALLPPADLARASDLQGKKAGVPRVPDRGALPGGEQPGFVVSTGSASCDGKQSQRLAPVREAGGRPVANLSNHGRVHGRIRGTRLGRSGRIDLRLGPHAARATRTTSSLKRPPASWPTRALPSSPAAAAASWRPPTKGPPTPAGAASA